MNSFTNKLGFLIPNSDIKYDIQRIFTYKERLFILTSNNEVIVFDYELNQFNKKFILLTSPQKRENITNLFIMNNSSSIFEKQSKNIIIILTRSLVLYYWNYKSGQCFSKVNLAKEIKNERLLSVSAVDARFISFIFEKKFLLFDCLSQTICLEYLYQYDEKNISLKDSLLKNCLKIKKNKYFLETDLGNIYLLSIKLIDFYQSQIKYDYGLIELSFYKSTYDLTNKIKLQSEGFYNYLSDTSEVFLFSENNILNYSLLDSVEDISILTRKQLSYQVNKFKVIFIGEIYLFGLEYIAIIYQNFQIDIYQYDKKFMSINLIKKYLLLVETDITVETSYDYHCLSMNNNILLYSNNLLYLFEFNQDELTKDIEEEYFNLATTSFAKSKFEEKFPDQILDLNDFMNKKLYISNYFKENFHNFKSTLIAELNKDYQPLNSDKKPDSDDKKYDRKKSKKKLKSCLSLTNLHYFTSNRCLFTITASNLFINKNDFTIFYIVGLDNGLVLLFEVFMTEEFNIKPILRINFHSGKINYLTVFDNRILIIVSEDGLISFTNISKKQTNIDPKRDSKNESLLVSPIIEPKANSIYNSILGDSSKKISKYDTKVNFINLHPYYSFRAFFSLKRISPVILLDSYSISDDQNKRKHNHNLSFIYSNNTMTIINMETTTHLLNFSSNTREIIGVYCQASSNLIMVLLDNYWLKLCSFASRTVERVIKDIDIVYQMLKIEEKLKTYFQDTNKLLINDFNLKFKKEQKEQKANYRNEFNYDPYMYEVNKQNKDKNISTGVKEVSVDSYSLSTINKKISHIFKQINSKAKSSNELIPSENITDENKIKDILYTQFNFYLYQRKKIYINSTTNKFDVQWIRLIEDFIVDDLHDIINNQSIDDKLKKLKIFNKLNFPLEHFITTKDKLNTFGIDSYTYKLGDQITQSINIDFIEFFYFLEKIVHEMKVSQTFLKIKHNIFNFLSLLRIWNISADQDISIAQSFKIFLPLFEFFPIMLGVDSASTILLTEEDEVVSNDIFINHFSFLFDEFSKINQEEKNKLKETQKLLDKKYILKYEKAFLTNFKFYNQSNDLSHLLNSFYFGSLISILGYDDGVDMGKLVSNELVLLRSLSNQDFIKFSNLRSLSNQLFDLCENITLVSKDIILVDYLLSKLNHTENRHYYSTSNSTVSTVSPKNSLYPIQFNQIIQQLKEYITKVHFMLFNDLFIKGEDQNHLSYFTQETLAELPNEKYLSEFDLLCIFLIISINTLSHVKLDDDLLMKTCQIMILYIFKILKNQEQRNKYCKVIIELISKSSHTFDKLFKENSINFTRLLIGLYTSIRIPIDLNGMFKKYEIGNCVIIKSEDNLNFMKIMIAKIIKSYSKTKINVVLKYIIDEFKHKHEDIEQYNYMMEIIWILFKDKNYKHIHYLPSLANLLMTIMNQNNKEIRMSCLENCKLVLAYLLPNYPMINFHQNSQRLAVGATDGKVFIYDISTGSIWKNLNAHGNEISALLFDNSGDILITYSSTEGSLKFWKIGLKGFLTTIFGMKDGYYKIKKYDICKDILPELKLNCIKLQLMPNNTNKVMLVREDLSNDVVSLS